MRVTTRSTFVSPFTKLIASLIERSEMTQSEIARGIGYDKSNIISMFKKGVTKVPIDKLPLLAKTLDTDQAYLTRMALREYHPDLYATLEQVFGRSVSENEFEVIRHCRKVTGDSNPKLRVDRHEDLARVFR